MHAFSGRKAGPLWIAVLLLQGCGDDNGGNGSPDPLEVVSIEPADGAATVETGAQVLVTFNNELELTTVTSGTITVAAGGTPLPTAVSYDDVARQARITAPLVPGALYVATVTTNVSDVAGQTLAQDQQFTFTTRTWVSVGVEGVGNLTPDPSLVLEQGGVLHAAYRDGSDYDLRYAVCAANCTTAASWQAATVDATGGVGLAPSLALGAGGRIHVTYGDVSNGDFKYATCAASCNAAVNWETTVVDGNGSGGRSSLLVDGTGRLHVSYQDDAFDLRYATCAASCDVSANWTSATVDGGPGGTGATSSIGIDGTGRLHVTYKNTTDGELDYATCAAGCTTPANWQIGVVDAAGSSVGDFSSLKVDDAGTLHATYADQPNTNLKYGSCASNCAVTASWQITEIDSETSTAQSSLVVTSGGRLHVSYTQSATDDLRYATCAVDCAVTANWRTTTVDAADQVGFSPSLVVDATGRPRSLYYDTTNDALKYIE